MNGSGRVIRKHAAFDPASQKRLGSRLRSYKKGTTPLEKRDCPLFVYHARSAFHTAFLPLCLRPVRQKLRVFEPLSLRPPFRVVWEKLEILILLTAQEWVNIMASKKIAFKRSHDAKIRSKNNFKNLSLLSLSLSCFLFRRWISVKRWRNCAAGSQTSKDVQGYPPSYHRV